MRLKLIIITFMGIFTFSGCRGNDNPNKQYQGAFSIEKMPNGDTCYRDTVHGGVSCVKGCN